MGRRLPESTEDDSKDAPDVANDVVGVAQIVVVDIIELTRRLDMNGFGARVVLGGIERVVPVLGFSFKVSEPSAGIGSGRAVACIAAATR